MGKAKGGIWIRNSNNIPFYLFYPGFNTVQIKSGLVLKSKCSQFSTSAAITPHKLTADTEPLLLGEIQGSSPAILTTINNNPGFCVLPFKDSLMQTADSLTWNPRPTAHA